MEGIYTLQLAQKTLDIVQCIWIFTATPADSADNMELVLG
jgi:hypothetical protein